MKQKKQRSESTISSQNGTNNSNVPCYLREMTILLTARGGRGPELLQQQRIAQYSLNGFDQVGLERG